MRDFHPLSIIGGEHDWYQPTCWLLRLTEFGSAKPVVEIPIQNLVVALVPAIAVLMILHQLRLGVVTSIYALGRMLLQLIALGFVLRIVFESDSAVVVLTVIALMLASASWISLRVASERRRQLYWLAATGIGFGGGATLVIVTQGVLNVDPWYQPRMVIPLAGMIFANCMNAVSLATERCCAELQQGRSFSDSRSTAIKASLIPITNTLFAVGLVAIPGMMTGQVLAGVSPLVAVRYQVVVMAMAFGSAGLASTLFLFLAGEKRLSQADSTSPG